MEKKTQALFKKYQQNLGSSVTEFQALGRLMQQAGIIDVEEEDVEEEDEKDKGNESQSLNAIQTII